MTKSDCFSRYAIFWHKCPALLYGLAIALGCMLAGGLYGETMVIACLCLAPQAITTSKAQFCRLGMAMALLLCTCLWVQNRYAFPQIPPSGIKGGGIVSFSSVSHQAHMFGDRFIYRGTLLHFVPDSQDRPLFNLKNIPIAISIPDKEGIIRPLATQDYLVKGVLKATKNGTHLLQASMQNPWIPLNSGWSLAETRYHLKQAVSRQIEERYHSPQAQSFLTGIATGSFDDRLMAHDFGRFGLQHIMAISGFHFAIIAAFFGLILRLLLPQRLSVVGLIFLLSSYFLFLGATPSVMRAWLMCLLSLLAVLFERKPQALNSLGVALGGVLLYDPLQIYNLGFQFSFATTAAILLLYSPINGLMEKIFIKRPLAQALKLPLLDKHAYIILSAIRKGCALALAVNAAALPLTLHYFHKFPWMSLPFNLFFPFLVSVSIILLILGFTGTLLLPSMGNAIHHLNDLYTQTILNLTAYTPRALDFYIRAPDWPPRLALMCLACLFVGGICWNIYAENKKKLEKEWNFI